MCIIGGAYPNACFSSFGIFNMSYPSLAQKQDSCHASSHCDSVHCGHKVALAKLRLFLAFFMS